MKLRLARALLAVFLLIVAAGTPTAAAIPSAPTLLAPANGANVQIPFTISWSAVSDPGGIVAYNWQISPSSSFTPVIQIDSTNGESQDIVSGLASGTYFWRVQAVNSAFEQGAWSQPRSFTVTGAGPGSPGVATLGPTQGYSTFHPWEVIRFSWTAVPGAVSYILHAATDPSFPVASRIQMDNIPEPRYAFAIADPEGNYSARVFAVNAEGIAGPPSNLITFSVFYNNPLPPPPSPIAPINGETLTLPVTLRWTDVPNPQPSGYDLEIARDPDFTNIEESIPQLNDPTRTVLSLTSGTKYWRVRSVQGNSSPTTAAVTAWSSTGRFAISSAPPAPVSVTATTNPLHSGNDSWVAIQLSAAVPSGGATIALSSSNPGALPVPATVTMPGNIAWMQFMVQAGQVTSPTPVTISASLNGQVASGQITVVPPSLKWLSMPSTQTGGFAADGIIMLNGQAPAGGAIVSLSSDSPAVRPPATATIPAGSPSVAVPIATSAVTTNTTATVTASWNGASVQSRITLTPQPEPVSLTLDPTTTIGQGGSSFGTVTVASAPPSDALLHVTSSHPEITHVSNTVMIPAGSTRGGINISTSAVSTRTLVTISVSGGGVTRSATLTVDPQPPPVPVAPTLLSPANDANPAQPITFDWSDVPNASSYTIQIDDSSTFSAPLVVQQSVTASQFTVSGLAAVRHWWRVRAVNVSGASPWSTVRRFVPRSAPATPTLSAISLNPSSVVGGNSVQGTATLTSAAPSGGAVVSLSSNNGVAGVPASVTIAAGATSQSFTVTTSAVTAATSATISGAYGGTTRSATLTINPPAQPAALSSVGVSPTSVTGGSSAQGTVTLTAAAPAGGFTVALSSSHAAATVPASVVVPQGATSATFAISTSGVTASTQATITASAAGVTRAATLTVNPPPQTVTLTVTASGRSGERVLSNPSGIDVAVGSSGSAAFAAGTSVTLSVSNGRDAVWSGACSSGGNKAKTCTFTLTGNASVSANVQ